jgi:hypothetical protein
MTPAGLWWLSAGVIASLIAFTGRSGRRRTAVAPPSPPAVGLFRSMPVSHPGQRLPCGTGPRRTGQRLIVTALGRALEDPGDLGEKVGAAARELAELGHRGRFLAAGQVAPAGPVAGLAGQLGDEDTISLRAIIDHTF